MCEQCIYCQEHNLGGTIWFGTVKSLLKLSGQSSYISRKVSICKKHKKALIGCSTNLKIT